VQENFSYLTIRQFADKFKMHPQTVRRAIHKGNLSAIRVGIGKNATFRIPVTELQRLGLINLHRIVDQMVEEKIKSINESVRT
jgi:excisionase family DNA binding protein